MSTTTSALVVPHPRSTPPKNRRSPPLHITTPFPPPLPSKAYNYEPYIPLPAPSIHTWQRSKLHTQTTLPTRPIFLSCNLSNPVHLASILAHGCEWSVVECLARGMTPAMLRNRPKTQGEAVQNQGDTPQLQRDTAKDQDTSKVTKQETPHDMTVTGVLLSALRDEILVLLESALRRRYGDAYQRVVEEVEVRVKDGGVVVVPAWVYRGRG